MNIIFFICHLSFCSCFVLPDPEPVPPSGSCRPRPGRSPGRRRTRSPWSPLGSPASACGCSAPAAGSVSLLRCGSGTHRGGRRLRRLSAPTASHLSVARSVALPTCPSLRPSVRPSQSPARSFLCPRAALSPRNRTASHKGRARATPASCRVHARSLAHKLAHCDTESHTRTSTQVDALQTPLLVRACMCVNVCERLLHL